MDVRYAVAAGPRCFRWRLLMLSGPLTLEARDFLLAASVWPGAKDIGDFNRFEILGDGSCFFGAFMSDNGSVLFVEKTWRHTCCGI